MKPLTNKEIKSNEKQKICYVCEETFCDDKSKKSENELYHKVRDHCYYTGKFRGANLAEEFKSVFECLGENTEKFITFSVLLKKEDDNAKIITYKLKFIDSYRFMQTSLSNLVDNLSGVYDKECKKCMERKKIRLNCEFVGFKNGRLNYKCKECKKSCTKVVSELTKNFPTLYKFCNGDLNKFFQLLRKGIYPYEYMDSWERYEENTILLKEAFYSELNLENITDKDYEHVKKSMGNI